MNSKTFKFIFISLLVLVVAMGIYSFGKSCWCYDEDDAKAQCAFEEEYVFSIMLGGTCIGPGCSGNVKVKCWDFDEKDFYVRFYNSWDPNCVDCYR